jgi:hypothetical protein
MTSDAWWTIELEGKPDFDMAMKRIYAWYACEIIDRAPVRFVAHNAAFNLGGPEGRRSPEEQKKRWYDVERRVDEFVRSIEGKRFHGETFPIFDPNLGPDVYASFYGAELTFGEVTSWSHPIIHDWDDMAKLKLDMNNEYFKKIEELMACAIERCPGKFLVGYTDLHPGEDCAMAWRGSERFCMDLYDYPEQARQLIEIAYADFHTIFDHVDAILKAAGTDLAHVVRVNAYLTDLGQFKAYNDVYKEFFADQPPARTTIGCLLNGINVEIDCIAVLPDGR